MALAAKSKSVTINREAALLDYVERLRKFTDGRRAVHVRLSQLRPYNRRSHHLRIAATTFETLINEYEGSLFELFNADLVVILNGASVSDIDKAVLNLRYLFSEDPLLKSDEEDDIRFCVWYDLEEDYPELSELARRMVSAREQHERKKQPREETSGKKEAPREPLDAHKLASIEEAIAQADLSTIIRRQAICAVARNLKPQPAYYEIYTSIESLRQTLMPSIDILSNPWLFQDLTVHLDRRMISYLTQNDDVTLNGAFSVNLNVSTLISPGFLDFDEAQSCATRDGIVIELQLFDVFADLGNFLFARDFLRERGYKFCLDGATHLSLPLIDRKKLGFDLVKLMWSADLYDQLSGLRGSHIRDAAKNMGSERLILARCDSEQALEIGESIGITLYQGRLLDEMISRNLTRKDSIEALTDALARQRAASRKPNQD